MINATRAHANLTRERREERNRTAPTSMTPLDTDRMLREEQPGNQPPDAVPDASAARRPSTERAITIRRPVSYLFALLFRTRTRSTIIVPLEAAQSASGSPSASPRSKQRSSSTRRLSQMMRRRSEVGDKIQSAGDSATRSLQRAAAMRSGYGDEEQAFSSTPAPGACAGHEQSSSQGQGPRRYGPAELDAELNRQLDGAGLTSAALEPAPAVFSRAGGFALAEGEALDYAEYEQWRERCTEFIRLLKVIASCEVGPDTTSLRLKDVHDLSEMVVSLLQRCQQQGRQVKELSMHGCTLSNTALTGMCQLLQSQLQELDLHGTRGFDDRGMRALAYYCKAIRTLRLTECGTEVRAAEGEQRAYNHTPHFGRRC